MKIIKLNSNNQEQIVSLACQVLKRGGLVVYPTETCYGLGADCENQAAVNKLLSYKKRREGKPLSVLVTDKKMAQRYVNLNESAQNFYKRFLPGPMTVVSESRGLVATGVESELKTLGIRISSHDLAMAIVEKFNRGITATSANASYKKRPFNIDDLLKPLSDNQKSKLDFIIDGGQLPKRESSTVVDTSLVTSMVLRKGDLSLGDKKFAMVSNSEAETIKLAQTLGLKHWKELRNSGLVIGLIGDLGVGKTVFTKGLGKFLNIEDEIVSPSYILSNEYEWDKNGVRGKFYHLDPWRLESFDQFLKLGFKQMLKANNLVAIEWINKYIDELEIMTKKNKIKLVKVYFEDLGDSKRKVEIDD